MPRAPRFRTSSLRDLYGQLRYAPETTLARIMDAADALLDEIEADTVYPEDFVIYRLTKYRSETTDEPAMLVGEALIADLATFVQEVSKRLELPAESDRRGHAHTVETIAGQLNVSSRTLRRYHRRGLLFHYVSFGNGRVRLACYESSIERFRRREPGVIQKAGSFSRLEPDVEQRLIDEAVEIARAENLTRQEIARRLAEKHDRAVETVRGILERFERQSKEKVFRGRRRTRRRQRDLAIRAARFGIDVAEIADRLDKSRLTIRRLVNAWRIERIRACELDHLELPTFSLPDAEVVILSPAAVRTDLGPPVREFDAIELIEELRAAVDPPAADEEARIAAYHFLVRRVRRAVESIDPDPSDGEVDRLETDLRWAALLKRTLVFSAMPTALLRIEQNLARPLAHQDSQLIRSLLSLAVNVISAEVERVDPSRGQRIARMTALAVDRALARLDLPRGDRRAGALHRRGSIPLGDPFAQLSPWQEFVELPVRFVRRLHRLEETPRRTIDLIYGLSGEHPRTRAVVADTLRVSNRAINRIVRDAERLLRMTDH